ncbi:MAG: hypothetical protein CMB28_01650 [Euryarchaeota archaeon]|nr:hypothetical protein [Euryarchaeota archaeon]|tara:strand:+ start:2545 stop:3576 length:1032 start_codon:yes stop_codon:yes gene_type:complete
MNPEEIIHAFENGERELEPLLEKMGWTSWLGIAELGLVLQSDIVAFLEDKLSPAESKVLELVKKRIAGEIDLDSIEEALAIARTPETRDLALEGRLRMERGLVHFENGKIEDARDDLTWAETRLKSVAKASRDHDISLLNKAAFHLSIDEPMMALHVHGEISRKSGHANETIAISRIQASRIHLAFGHIFDAARCAFNAHAHAMIAKQIELAVESGAIFVEISSGFISKDAEKFADQVTKSKPLSAGETAPVLQVHPDDVYGVLEWCIENTQDGYSGEERPDLRALVMLAKRLDKPEMFADLLSSPSEVDDAHLAALCASISEGDSATIWTDRVTEIMTLKDI